MPDDLDAITDLDEEGDGTRTTVTQNPRHRSRLIVQSVVQISVLLVLIATLIEMRQIRRNSKSRSVTRERSVMP